jgi:hypothetical protein
MTASSGLMFCGGLGKKYARMVEVPEWTVKPSKM